MGHSPSNIPDTDDPDSQLKLHLILDKPVRQQLKQLLNWSLPQIRSIYSSFRRRKTSPLLTRSQFLHFIQLSRISSFYIYDNITKNTVINAFQVLCILVIGAYTNYIYKIQFLFNAFDLRSKKRINFYQLILIFKSLIRGYCFLTNQPLPQNQLLDKYSNAMFSKADLNNDQLLQLSQYHKKQHRIINWLQNSPQNLYLLKLYQPSISSKQDYYLFNSYKSYSQNQINIIITRINKIYQKRKAINQDYSLLKSKINTINNQNYQSYSNSLSFNQSFHSSPSTNKQPLLLQNPSQLSQSIPNNPPKQSSNIYFPLIQNKSKPKRKYPNTIIIQGKMITKKQIFQLRQYFDHISTGKKYILLDDFIQNFNQDRFSHMKSVAPSLFNFLDKHQQGKILFLDLVTKLYPTLTHQHLSIIQIWSEQYNRNFNLNKKIKVTDNNEQIKKRILPRTCITRLQQLYSFFDTQQKGYVNIQNLRQILGKACTQKQIQLLFQNSDTDKDGKLTLKQFVHVLLPSDLQIQGLI